MGAEQLVRFIVEHPGWALGEYVDHLTGEQFDFCIREAPDAALYFVQDKFDRLPKVISE